MQKILNFSSSNDIEYILDTHSSIIENNNIHPAFRVAEKIYSNETSSFFESISSPEKSQNSSKKMPNLSMTPIPTRYYKDQNSYQDDKADIFLNPSLIYLSKKPIAFNKLSRERQRKNNSIVSPIKNPYHNKTKSYESSPIKIKLPKIDHSQLIPIEDIKAVSPRLDANQSFQAKEIHCKALTRIAGYCENNRAKAPFALEKKQKIANKYSEKMNWVTDVLQSYGEYDYRILNELFKYSSESRNEMENERANVVHMMKTGAYDPNKNAVKLRTRIKKNKISLNSYL
ncbi:hypothetical protein SteCoe_35710 [Stentor coeruleus]|uniref:Uncharacterized protein n=1 Tax=Stentor coeruleus TaxID=5963 RepID=A0A1R2ARP3_9CILI|nr:hypothetical protein SteCoe_35710 [Stentor coeruleus]